MIYAPSPENIARAAQLIKNGGVVAFPTETVYGLGASAFDAHAVEKVFALKSRPRFDPLIVHLPQADLIEEVAVLASPAQRDKLKKLAAYWPGPLSVVLPRRPSVPEIVTAGLQSVAVRIPSHPVAQKFLRACVVPIAAPSANPFGYISPTCAAHVEKNFADKVEMILDGGDCSVGVESTVISLLEETPALLRHGAITLEMLRKAVGEIAVRSNNAADGVYQAPGMLKEHYAPHAPVLLKEKIQKENLRGRVGYISFSAGALDRSAFSYVQTTTLSSNGNFEDIARGLFAALHEMDSLALDLIVIDTCENKDLGRAIMDRLTRAASRS